VSIRLATTLIEAGAMCAPEEPLRPGDPRWQDFSPVRTDVARRIMDRLRGAARTGRYAHIPLAGHRGCGKSTELFRVQEAAEKEGFLVLYARVYEELTSTDVTDAELMLLISFLLERPFREKAPLDASLLTHISNWFREVTKLTEEEVSYKLGVEASAELGIGAPFFAKLLWVLKSAIQAGGTSKLQIREKVQPLASALVSNVNLLLDDARKKLPTLGKQEVLFIFDNVDRYTAEEAHRLLIEGAERLKALQFHAIYTVPITISLMEQALRKRVDVDGLFAAPDLVRKMARLSGGCIRDMLHIAQQTFLEAQGRKVDRTAFELGASRVRDVLTRKLSAEHYELLARVHDSHRVPSDEAHRFLLFHRAILEYTNGGRWGDAHPLLWETEEFKDAWAQIRSSAHRV
jgi:hypothetical protein